MPRPRKMRWINARPCASLFKPAGVSARPAEHVLLEMDEIEALRLADLENMNHEDAAGAMQISRATFGRIVARARRKSADALIHGKVIRIGSDPAAEESSVDSADTLQCPRGRIRKGCGRGRWI